MIQNWHSLGCVYLITNGAGFPIGVFEHKEKALEELNKDFLGRRLFECTLGGTLRELPLKDHKFNLIEKAYTLEDTIVLEKASRQECIKKLFEISEPLDGQKYKMVIGPGNCILEIWANDKVTKRYYMATVGVKDE